MTAPRTVDEIIAAFPAGSVTMLPAEDVAALVAEVERLRRIVYRPALRNDVCLMCFVAWGDHSEKRKRECCAQVAFERGDF